MRTSLRIASMASATVLLAGLAACSVQPVSAPAPVAAYPASSYPAGSRAPVYVEYGRVTGVEVIRTQEPGQTSGVGAVVGGIAGGVVGNQIGGGSGRDIARIAGVVGGALAGNAIEKNSKTQVRETYRVSVQTDNGAYRSYDLASASDLRAGDRVRIQDGQLFRY
ncbi:MAG: outer membrane lipoprotein [Polaromonas sp.]